MPHVAGIWQEARLRSGADICRHSSKHVNALQARFKHLQLVWGKIGDGWQDGEAKRTNAALHCVIEAM